MTPFWDPFWRPSDGPGQVAPKYPPSDGSPWPLLAHMGQDPQKGGPKRGQKWPKKGSKMGPFWDPFLDPFWPEYTLSLT